MKRIISIILIFTILVGHMQAQSSRREFIRIENGRLQCEGKAYRFIGANFWYGALLGTTNRERLNKELDLLSGIGVENLRILIGADGLDGYPSKVQPSLQLTPGVYNDKVLDGLDYLLSEMGKRHMHAVLFLNNSWEWSGGYSAYLNWAGNGEIPMPRTAGWDAFSKYVGDYAKSEQAHQLFECHIKYILGRVNRYTNRQYVEDATIMAWQIANEPRPFGICNKNSFAKWIASAAALIKKLDHNHLVSTGMEGVVGAEEDMALYSQIHADPNIDYLTIHIWPYNWNWIKKNLISKTLSQAIINTQSYIDRHLQVAEKLNKPLILEEFGLPRDNMSFKAETPTRNRNIYYRIIFKKICQQAKECGLFQGCNFWAWSGYARPKHIMWQNGDEYLGDPAQEEQGLNSVFNTDSTIKIMYLEA